jgi:hypothetical protein
MESKVVCWLCDGPHSFHQCKELECMKSVCIQYPNVLKHFQHLLLKKDGEGIKILTDAPEFFDDALTDNKDDLDNHNNDDADQHIKLISFTCNSSHVDGIDGQDDPAPFFILAVHDDDHIPINCTNVNTTLYNDLGIECIKSLTFDNMLPCIKLLASPYMVQVDGGADQSTTPHRELVHGFCPPNLSLGEKTTTNDAGAHSHKII